MALTDEETLLKRGKVKGHECLSVMNRTNGKVVAGIESLCHHDPGLLAPHTKHSNNIFEFCGKCNEIRVYDTCNIGDRRVIYKKCTPRGMCSGSGNTLFVIDISLVIWHCEWNHGDKNLKVIRKIKTKLLYPGCLLKMCHSARNNSLIVLSIGERIDAVSLADGSLLWTLPSSIGGLDMHPYGVCCNTNDGCILICNGYEKARVLTLDPFRGHVLQIIRITDAFILLSDLSWSNSQPHLTVLGINKEETDLIGCFSVEDNV